jgi:hypothetical protein
MQRWFEVTVPLTLIILALAGFLLYWGKVKRWLRLQMSCASDSAPLGDEEKTL